MSYHGMFWHRGPPRHHKVSTVSFRQVERPEQSRRCGHLLVGSDWASRCWDHPGTCCSSTTTGPELVLGHTGTRWAEARHSRHSRFQLWHPGRGRCLGWRGDSGWPTSRAEHHHHRMLWGTARGLVRPNSLAPPRGKRQTCRSRNYVLKRETGK